MSQQSLTTFALIALMAVAFYFLILRPQKKRQQQQQKTMSAITPGSRVMTGSGLFGTVVSVGEKQILIEISPGVNMTLLKPAVSRVVGPEDEDGPVLLGPDTPYESDTHYQPDTQYDPGTYYDPGTHAEPNTSGLDLPRSHTEDLGPSASDVTPGRTNQSPGNDPSTKE